MAGFPSKGGFNKGGFPSKGGFASKTGNTPELYFSAKWGQYNDKDELEIRLGAFKNEDVNIVNQIAPDVFYVKAIQVKLAKFPSYSIFVKPGQVQAFEGMLDKLKTVLEQTQHYKGVAAGMGYIQDIISDTPSNEEIANQEKTVVSNWRDLLLMFQDPEVRKRFLAYQTTYIKHSEFSPAVLSRDNVLKILNADPQATFVTQAYVWRNVFNRDIQHGAPSIIITKCDIDIPYNILEADPEVKKYGGWKAVKAASGGKETNYPAWGIKNRIAKEPGHNHFMRFRPVKAYDVRFTIPPTNAKDDKFVNMVNLVNNLTGELNEVAKTMLKDIDTKAGKGERDFKKIEGLENDELLTKFREFTMNKCKLEKIPMQETNFPKNDIANGVFAYSYKKSETQNILKDSERNIFASAVCAAVGLTFNIDCDKVSQCGRVISALNDQKLIDVVDKSFHVFQEFNSFNIREANGVDTKDDYFRLLKSFSKNAQPEITQEDKQVALQESFTRKFNDLVERMNNVPR